MKLTDLRKKGAFVSPALVEKEVSWTHPDPETGKSVTDSFTVHVRRLSYGQLENVIRVMPKEDSERSYNAATIALAVVFGEDPERSPESISYDEAYALDPSLAQQLVLCIQQVNRRGEFAKKPSSPPTKSGTSSSSTESVGEPSPKPRKTSPSTS